MKVIVPLETKITVRFFLKKDFKNEEEVKKFIEELKKNYKNPEFIQKIVNESKIEIESLSDSNKTIPVEIETIDLDQIKIEKD